MNKSELIDTIGNDGGLSRADATRAVNSLTTTVAMILKKGEEVTITGLASSLCPSWRRARDAIRRPASRRRSGSQRPRGSPPDPQSRPQSPAAASNHR
jgi:nucleoid DNA-binding protein